jgi:uncharacterized protein (DUF885 family)
MVDRRYVLGALGALMGAVATDAIAKAKPKKASSKKAAASKSTKGKKSKADAHDKGKKGKHGKAEPRHVVETPREPPPPPVPEVSSPEASAALNAAYEQILKEQFLAQPTVLTSLGFDKGEYASAKSRIEDRSEASKAATLSRLSRAVQALNAVDRDQLSAGDRIQYDSVRWDYATQQQLAQSFAYGDYGVYSWGFASPYVISQLSGAYQYVPDLLDGQHTIKTRGDAEAYLTRLDGFARALDQETERFRLDLGRGVVPPDFVINAALKQLTALRDADPAASTLINSIDRRATAAGIAGTWKDDATAKVTGPVKDALTRQIDLLTATLPNAKHDASVRNLPDGDAYYVLCAKLGTSTDNSPREIHLLGLDLVGKLTDEIDRRLRQLGLTQGSVGARMNAMTVDPKYIYPNTDEGKAKLLSDLNAKVAAVQARLPQYFGVLPKAKVSIRRIPAETEAGAPGGYYQPGSIDGSRPGVYNINLRDTANNPSWTLPTLTYHEAIPGHHLQGTIQNEAQLPMIRKIQGFNAYIEGWALYAEQLAGEMGMYDNDPAGRIGYLHDALFRAVRLVVDTGMHYLGWSREQAITYMVDATGDTQSAAATEIERYAVWPGQALGYMVGKLTWLRLRDAAKAKQKGDFDIKAFHDTGLTAGSVPLSVLEQVYRARGMI